MDTGITLISLCLIGCTLAALTNRWSERRRMTTILTLLVVAALTLLAMR